MKWMMFSMKIKKQTVIQRIAPPLETVENVTNLPSWR